MPGSPRHGARGGQSKEQLCHIFLIKQDPTLSGWGEGAGGQRADHMDLRISAEPRSGLSKSCGQPHACSRFECACELACESAPLGSHLSSRAGQAFLARRLKFAGVGHSAHGLSCWVPTREGLTM